MPRLAASSISGATVSSESWLVGSGGGGGGGEYHNRPDNLRSTDTFETLLGLCSGPIKGLAPGGLKNLFVDDVPLEAGDGSSNYDDFTAALWTGDPSTIQPINLALGGSSGPEVVNLPISNDYASAPGEWVVASMAVPGCNFIDLRFIVQQLYKQDEDGIRDATATLEVELQPSNSSTWYNPLADTSTGGPISSPPSKIGLIIYAVSGEKVPDGSGGHNWVDDYSGKFKITGKTTSTYVKEVRIGVPRTGAYAGVTWTVRVRLHEQDHYTDGEQTEIRRTLSWETIAGVKTDPIGDHEAWRALAYLHLLGKASDQLSGIPPVQGIYDLQMHQVPPNSVWNPETRVYTGAAWDGSTTQLAWTPCPAFQIKGIIEDAISGVSALTPGSTLNKWDALEASKWFAQQVPDGKGGTHCRYSAHWLIESGASVHELVNYLAGAVGAYCWDDGDGTWRMKVEKPENPVMLFTKESITGEFVYSHTDIDTRYNSITCIYRDKDARYRESRVRVYDQAHIDQFGLNHTTLVMVGCDNRQEAIRRGWLRLRTNLKETRSVVFSTNRLGGLLQPLDVIAIADSDLMSSMDQRTTGRIVNIDPTRTIIDVRDPMRLEVGTAYSLKFMVPNDGYTPSPTLQPSGEDWRDPVTVLSRNVVNTAGQRGDVTRIYLSSALPADLPEYAVVALDAVGLPALPKQYRVLGVTPGDDGESVAVSAVEIYTNKWAEADNITEEDINNQTFEEGIGPPTIPDDGMFHVSTYDTQYTTRRTMSVNWVRPISPIFDHYSVQYRYNGGTWTDYGFQREDFIEIQDPAPGKHEVRVYAIGRNKEISLPLIGSYELDEIPIYIPQAYLTNESHTVATLADGTGFSLAGAGGSMIVTTAVGPITAGITYSVAAQTGCTATINASGAYTITGLSADQGSVTFRAVFFGWTIDRIYSISKSKAGVDGSPARTVTVISDRQTIFYDPTGAPNPASQTTTFTANGQNLDGATINWSVTDIAGVARTPVTSYLSAATGTSVTMTEAQFAAARNSKTGVIVTASATVGGVTYSDKISVVRVSAGADGDDGIDASNIIGAPVIVNCDHVGVPLAGQMPQTVQFQMFIGSTDVTALATWSAPVVTNGAATSLGGGAFQITALTADTGAIEVFATYAGYSAGLEVSINKVKAGSPAQSSNLTGLGQPGTSYGITAAGTVQYNVFPGQTVQLSHGSSYDMQQAGGGHVRCKFYYRNITDGGAWTQVGSEIIGSNATWIETIPGEPELTPGYCGGGASLAGPASAKIYEFRMEWLRTNLLFVNSANFQVSIS